MEITPVVAWIVFGIVLIAADVFLGTFYLIVMGLAAGAAALAAWGDVSVGWQFTLFAAATAAGGFVVLRCRARPDKKAEAIEHPDAGQSVTVDKWQADGTTVVMYRGARWTAQAAPDADLHAGAWRIVRVDGARLVIEPAAK